MENNLGMNSKTDKKSPIHIYLGDLSTMLMSEHHPLSQHSAVHSISTIALNGNSSTATHVRA